MIDSQSVKATESGGHRGYDAGKKVNGCKRHMLSDTLGLMIETVVHSADIRDRDGAPLGLKPIRDRFPFRSHVFADGGYAGQKCADAFAKTGNWSIEIIKRSDAAKGFVLLPQRWVVERTLAWLSDNRGLARDFKRALESATAWLFLASVQLLTRKLTRH